MCHIATSPTWHIGRYIPTLAWHIGINMTLAWNNVMTLAWINMMTLAWNNVMTFAWIDTMTLGWRERGYGHAWSWPLLCYWCIRLRKGTRSPWWAKVLYPDRIRTLAATSVSCTSRCRHVASRRYRGQLCCADFDTSSYEPHGRTEMGAKVCIQADWLAGHIGETNFHEACLKVVLVLGKFYGEHTYRPKLSRIHRHIVGVIGW